MKIKHNDYYGHINKIQEYAIQHPEWFWSDAAAPHRQWLYDNGASSIIDTIYEETPDNLKPTDYKILPKTVKEKNIKDKIYQGQNNFINQAVETGFRSINLPGTMFDFYANQKSNGEYDSFGQMLRKGEDKGFVKNIGYEFLNPGNSFDLLYAVPKLGTKAVKDVIQNPGFKKALTDFKWQLGPKTWKQGDEAVKMFKRYGTQAPKIETTRLYRAQQVNPTFNPKTAANGEAQAAYAGQWFTPNVEKIDWYALNASNKGTPVEIQYVDIPTKDLKKYAAEGIVPKNFDLEIGEDFIIPETIKRTTIPLNNTTKLNILEHTASNAAKSAPEFTSPLMERIKKYVPEARERYGLVGRTDITDDEIAGSLYKKAMALSKPGNAAVNEFGEPLLLFRGDTRRYRSFEPKLTPDQLAKGSGSMDNAFGNLFLGDLGKGEEGVERYINYVIEQPSGYKMIRPSATGDKAHFGNLKFKQDFDDNATIFPESALSYDLQPPSKRTGGISIRTRKLLPDFVDSGVNDINGFIINTPGVRNATMEISPEMGGRFVVIDGKPRFKNGNGVDRDIAAKRMQQILDEAKMRKEGLLLSKKNSPLRESEHSKYDYYALPNFNINGAKSILPYDLNRPSTFIDKGFVYRKNGGKI